METRKIRLDYPLKKLGVSVFSQLASQYDVQPSVLAADIDHRKGGWLLLSISGSSERLDEALAWVRETGIEVKAAD